MRRGKRILLRERFFQNLEKEESTDHTMINSTEVERYPIHENISNDNPTITAPVLGNQGHENRRSSRKRLFQELENQGTSITSDNEIGNNVQNLSSLGQAHYQKQRQDVIIEYKDFGDNTYQCVYCNAYFWRDEKNSRGVYIGCCKHGQVR